MERENSELNDRSNPTNKDEIGAANDDQTTKNTRNEQELQKGPSLELNTRWTKIYLNVSATISRQLGRAGIAISRIRRGGKL